MNDLKKSLQKLGIGKGDTLLIHSDLSFLKEKGKKYKQVFEEFIETIFELIGEEGTIVIPSFTYSYCKSRKFDLQKSPSETGAFANYLITKECSYRSLHPIFSFVAYGKNAEEITSDLSKDAFDEASILGKLHEDYETKIIFINADFQFCTYCHYVEQKVGITYRYIKEFPGEITAHGETKQDTYTYLVRPLDGSVQTVLKPLEEKLLSEGLLRAVKNHNSYICAISVNDFVSRTEEILAEDEYFMLAEPPKQANQN